MIRALKDPNIFFWMRGFSFHRQHSALVENGHSTCLILGLFDEESSYLFFDTLFTLMSYPLFSFIRVRCSGYRIQLSCPSSSIVSFTNLKQ